MRIPILLLPLLLSRLLPFGQDPPVQSGENRPSRLVLLNAHVIDGTGSAPFMASVLIEEGRIAALDRNPAAVPEGARTIDLQGKTLLPGLIDAHVHIRGFDGAKRALYSGVTTARSMGVSHFVDVGLRELIRSGAAEGPEILAAGYHLRPGLSGDFPLDEPSLGDLLPGLKTPADFRRAAVANLDRGVDFLKAVATDRAGLPTTDPRRQIMSEEALAAVVEEGAQRGIPTAAHAHGDEGARAAVRAGVRSIEHGTYLSPETLRLMKERGTFLVPTVAVVRDLTEADGDYDNPVLRVRGRHMLPRVCRTVRQAHQLGVQIVASTDTGYGSESLVRMSHDILELTECGLSPMQAIQSATLTAAQLMQIDDRTGTVQPGKEADLIVVEGNPLDDLVTLQDVLLVVANGRIALNRVELGVE